MIKNNFILAVAALAAGCFGATGENVPVAKLSANSGLEPSEGAAVRSEAGSPRKAPSGAWTSRGTGVWSEDLFTYFGFVNPGTTWEVEVQESETTPGWYRVLPYSVDNNPVTRYLQDTDTKNYFYIDTRNPEKVYISDVKIFGKYWVSQYVEENDWASGADYGTLVDGVISFPPSVFDYKTPDGPWERIGSNGKVGLALPGAKTYDYTLLAQCDYCPDDEGYVKIDITAGKDIATVKYILMAGEYSCSENNAAVVATQGSVLEGKALRGQANSHNLYSFLLVGLDSEGSLVASTEAYYIGNDPNEEWTDAGTAVVEEAFFHPLYTNVEAETLTVPYQESKTHPGLIRIVEPYKGHSFYQELGHGHTHYMYIDAMSEYAVYVLPSAVGINFGFGDAAVWSWAGRYVSRGQAQEAFDNSLFGTRSGNVLTIPDNTLLAAEKGYSNGAFTGTGAGFKITLRPTSGIDAVEAGEAEGEWEYFTLSGIRVASAAVPGLYIRRNAATGAVSKLMVR